LRTLKFADRAKSIFVKVMPNEISPNDEGLIKKLTSEINTLKEIINIRKKRGIITDIEMEFIKLKEENEHYKIQLNSNNGLGLNKEKIVEQLIKENKLLKLELQKLKSKNDFYDTKDNNDNNNNNYNRLYSSEESDKNSSNKDDYNKDSNKVLPIINKYHKQNDNRVNNINNNKLYSDYISNSSINIFNNNKITNKSDNNIKTSLYLDKNKYITINNNIIKNSSSSLSPEKININLITNKQNKSIVKINFIKHIYIYNI
jgi:hypothetical protein